MKKKFLVMALTALSVLGISACNFGDPEFTTSEQPVPTTTSEQPAPTTTSEPTPTTSEPAPTTSEQPAPTTTSEPTPTTSEPAPTTSEQPAPTTTSEPEPTTSTATPLIITVNTDNITIKINSEVSIANYITISKPDGSKVSASEKNLNLSTDDPNIISFANQGKPGVLITGKQVGECILTITSKKYPDIHTEVAFTVEDAFFDYTISSIDTSKDDISKEMPASRDQNGGEVTINSVAGAQLYMRDRCLTKFYFESSIEVMDWDRSDNFPKFGIMLADMNGGSFNGFGAFFNTECDQASKYFNWDDVGFVERGGAGDWGWNPDVPDSTARHADKIAKTSTKGKNVKLGVYRDGLNFHLFVDGSYKRSMKGLPSLYRNSEEQDIPLNIGLFTFVGSCRFYDYKLVENEAQLANYASMVGTGNWVTQFDPKNV